MEPLRWILIAVGIVFIVAIYFFGKNRRDQGFSSREIVNDVNDAYADMDLPEFSASKLDDFDEGVGEVRVVSGGDPYEERGYGSTDPDNFEDSFSQDEVASLNESSESVEGADVKKQSSPSQPKDIIVVYILPKGDTLLQGAQVNSAAQALGLSFGEMNIYHYITNGRTIFSLANMLEPGSFNPETIHDLKTSGLTLFMQIKGDDPMDDLTEMLQRSYQIAGLLEARLCNHKRDPLTEQDAENYRAQVRHFI